MYFNSNEIELSSKAIHDQLVFCKTKLESPIRISGVTTFRPKAIGAFTFFRGGSVESLESIGRFCSVAPNVTIGPTEHDVRLLTTSPFLNSWDHSEKIKIYWQNNREERKKSLTMMRENTARNRQSVTIGNDVWIGQNAVIRRGVKIGNGAVIAANSVVSKDVNPYEIVGGSPAKHIRYRFPIEHIHILEKVQWWNWSLDSLNGIAWSNIDSACKELLKRYESKEFKNANYEIFVLDEI